MRKGDRQIRNNLVGQRFGRLSVFEHAGYTKHGGSLYKCQCDCGSVTTVAYSSLVDDHTKSCGCYRAEITGKRNLTLGKAAAKSRCFREYVRGADRRNIPFELTEEEFFKLTKENCFYCGQEPSHVIKPIRDTPNPDSFYICNGVDRFDNTLGYTTDNCVACCTTCNTAKSTMSFEEFVTWVKRVHNHIVHEGYK